MNGGLLFYEVVAQLDRASDCGSEGRTFESCQPHMEFREDLNIPNKTCPPTEAVSGRFTVYRLVDNIPIQVEDIWSYRALYPAKVFKNECIARACSVYGDSKDLKRLRKIPKFKRK